MAFHTDYLRMLEVRDIELRRAAWWQVGVAKTDFEAFRKRLLGEARGKAILEKQAEEDVFDLEASPGAGGEGPGSTPPAGGAGGALGRQLAALKKDVDKEPQKKKHKRREEKGKDKDKARGADAPEREKRKRPRSNSPAGGASGSLVKKGPLWFGKARAPKERASSDAGSDRSRGRGRRRHSRSPSSRSRSRRRRRRSRKERDRGPYGIGREMAFDRGESGPSASESAEEGFQRGVSDRRSHQLKLVEYSQKRPGRLASRLLVKMQELLARDTGTPINLLASENMTPATATGYLLTVLIPTHKDKLGVRLLREMRTVAMALDYVATGRQEAAADLLAQRMKALELQLVDGGWQRAQYLELIQPEGASLAEQEEQRMAAREQATEAKLRLQVQPKAPWNPEPKGKGDVKGKGRGKKGGKRGEWTTAAAEIKEKAPPT